MEPEVLGLEQSLIAGAIALGAVCAMAATLLLFPVIDRFVRPRFELERGSAMLVLLGVSLSIGAAAGFIGYFWLLERQAEEQEEPLAVQVYQAPAVQTND